MNPLPKKPPANDNGTDGQPPRVIAPSGHPERTYARAGNLLLPLRFARRMRSWTEKRPLSGERISLERFLPPRP